MKILWLLVVVAGAARAECGSGEGAPGTRSTPSAQEPGPAPALDTCSACRCVDQEVLLCEAHAAEELSVCGREGARLKAKTEPERIAALEALAALTRAHTNAPSPKVVSLIATALEDESYAVRERATHLLGPPQHAEAVLSELTKALAAAEKERLALARAADKLVEKLDQKHLLDSRRRALRDELNATFDKLNHLKPWRAGVLDQLAAIPDDRAVDAICRTTPRDLVLGGSEALVRLGSQPAMNAFLAGLKAWELQHGAPASQGLEVKIEGTLILSNVTGLLLKREIARVKSGATAGTAPPLSASSGVHEAWNRWVQEHMDEFPEHLPGVKVTW